MNCQVYYEFHYNSFKGHEFHYTFVTHFIPKSFFGHAKTTHFIPNTKKKKKKRKKRQILVKVYNILSNYIPITFTYPFHTQYKKSHFITHSKGMNYIPISLQFIQREEVTHFITYPFHTHSKGMITYPLITFNHYRFHTQNKDE